MRLFVDLSNVMRVEALVSSTEGSGKVRTYDEEVNVNPTDNTLKHYTVMVKRREMTVTYAGQTFTKMSRSVITVLQPAHQLM